MTKPFISSVATSKVSSTAPPVSIRHLNKSPLRQRFIDYLILQQKARRTVETYTDWIRHLATFHHRSPDRLGQPEIRSWLLHLITERKLSASSINLAINALRAFYGRLLGQDIEPLLVGIKSPPRRIQPPRVFGPEEIERLITIGTAGDPFARVFLMTVFGGGFRLYEATHLQVSDIDGVRLQLGVSHAKGGRQRMTLLSPVLLAELRQLEGAEFVRRLSLHILPAGFTKIRHYGILGNNRRSTFVPLARLALEKSPWRLEFAPVPQTPLPKPEPSGCPRCGSEDTVCVGQLDASGRFTGLRKGAMRVRLKAG